MKNNVSRVGILVILALAGLMHACSPAPAAGGLAGAQTSQGTIQVVGVGEAEGAPDVASIQMGLSLMDSNLEVLIQGANTSIEKITAALVAAGVQASDIRTTNYGIWPEEIYDRLTGESTGERRYHADLTLAVTIRNIDRMGEFIQAGLDAGVNNIYGVSFGLEARSGLEASARAEAIVDARARAEQLASGLGKQVGRALSISEGIAAAPVIQGAAYAEGLGGGAGAPISPGQSSVSVEVIIVYELID